MEPASELDTSYPTNNGRSLPIEAGTLTQQTMLNLNDHFLGSTAHRPTAEMYAALEAAAVVLEDMANRTCQRSYFLSSLDPGVGKTSMVTKFTRCLLNSAEHCEVAMVICVARLSEIGKLVAEMGLPKSAYAAFTSDIDINRLGLGSDNTDQARVLFTTQQMVESRCDGKSFEATPEFHYRGMPRAVRVWDESLLPGETLTVTRQALMSTVSHLMKTKYATLAALLDDLQQNIKGVSNGSIVRIPEFGDMDNETGFQGLLEVLSGYPEDQRAVSSLRHLSGRNATVMNDGGENNTVLSYRDTLPEDFAPVLVLDASGRVRKTYPLWHSSNRKNLEILPSATKTYSNLTCHVWLASGGKSAFRDGLQRDQRIDAIASLIATKPEENWLVVHHKAEKSFDVEREITALLPEDHKGRVAFVPWGSHKATNDYVSFPNVVLAGTLFFPNSQYAALGRLSSALPDNEVLRKESLEAVVLGEHMDHILQAACRGAIRQSQGGDCPPSNLYIIASKKSGIEHALQEVFPGSKLREWFVGASVLKGKAAEVAEYVREWLTAHPFDLLPHSQVRDAVGGMDPKNFRSRIRRNPMFIDEMEEFGITETNRGRGKAGFVMAAADYGFLPIDA